MFKSKVMYKYVPSDSAISIKHLMNKKKIYICIKEIVQLDYISFEIVGPTIINHNQNVINCTALVYLVAAPAVGEGGSLFLDADHLPHVLVGRVPWHQVEVGQLVVLHDAWGGHAHVPRLDRFTLYQIRLHYITSHQIQLDMITL